MLKNKQQNGYSILSVILMIVAIIVTISIWVISGQSNINTINNRDKLYAASIIAEGAKLKLGYDRVAIAGYKHIRNGPNSSAEPIIYFPNALGRSNIADFYDGIKVPIINRSVLRDDALQTEGVFTYNSEYFKGNIGTNAADPTMLLFGIKDSVCKAINENINGVYVLPAMTLPIDEVYNTYPMSGSSYDLTSLAIVKDWNSGCISAKPGVPDNGMYFKIMQVF